MKNQNNEIRKHTRNCVRDEKENSTHFYQHNKQTWKNQMSQKGILDQTRRSNAQLRKSVQRTFKNS